MSPVEAFASESERPGSDSRGMAIDCFEHVPFAATSWKFGSQWEGERFCAMG